MRELELVLKYLVTGVLVVAILSCNTNSTDDTEIINSLEPVEEISLVPGAENASITVNKGQNSYLSVEIGSINNDEFTGLGTLEAWCIDWRKPLDISNGVYSGIQVYSTFQVEKWSRINYLLNILDDLRDEDPELTFREIQIVVWALRLNPEFDPDNIEVDDLPSRLLKNGKPDFDIQKVEHILNRIEQNHTSFDFVAGTRYALVLETPADVQTIFAMVE